MEKQRYTSAATSINAAKLPAVYGRLTDLFDRLDYYPSTIVDYGCGRFTDHLIRAAYDLGAAWRGIDPYNQGDDVNNAGRAALENGGACLICSNVLNVIDSDDVIRGIIAEARRAAVSIFTIYEGNRSGAGAATKADCYQRNEKTRDYLRFFPEGAYIRGGCIIMDQREQ